MKRFHAHALDMDRGVILSELNRVEEFYETVVKKEEDIIVHVGKKDFLVIGSPVASKIKNGDFQVFAQQDELKGEDLK